MSIRDYIRRRAAEDATSELRAQRDRLVSLLEDLRTARPLVLYGEGWIDRINQELAELRAEDDRQ